MQTAAVLTFLSVLLGLLAPLRAQGYTQEQFRAELAKGIEYNDPKLIDRAIKKDGGPAHTVLYFEELCVERLRAKPGETDQVRQARDARLAAMREAWPRCFENSQTLEKVHRWVDGMDDQLYQTLQKSRSSAAKLWNHALTVFASQVKQEYATLMQQFVQLARAAEGIGHAVEAADLWNLASVVGSKMPDKTIEDRREVLFAIEQFLLQRQAWEYTGDSHYVTSLVFVKDEKVRIEEAQKEADKRKAAGYDPSARGVDSLVMAGVAEQKHALEFEALQNWENELDYGPKNGPLPLLWWNLGLGKEGSFARLNWFHLRELWLARTSAAKFAIAFQDGDLKTAQSIEVSGKPKPSTFWLDDAKKVPYAMFFWAGSDRERLGEAEPNLAFTTDSASIYYRSAASWKVTIGAEQLTFYDDNASGKPADGDPFEPPFRVHTLGEHAGEGTVVPLFDSMRIGKGPRVPFTEFVKLATGWHHLHRVADTAVGIRPLNPEFFKTGKVKLVWNGPKPTAPAQLVIQGSGDYKTACFDVAGGKEIEVPAGQYAVVFGRVVAGKGARAQCATLYRGSSAVFDVEPGKTKELKMGAPFTLQFTRRGDENASIDALSILLQEASGCVLTEFHNGIALVPEVLAAKADDGKGAKPVAKFVKMTDAELLNEAAKKHGNLGLFCATFPMPEGYRSGELVLTVKLPAPGMKLALHVKKHPLFGEIKSAWQ